MRRREILASSALVATAGCLSSGGSETTTDEPRPGTATKTPTKVAETETGAKAGGAEYRDILEKAERVQMRPDLLSARISSWAYVGKVRYYDEATGGLEFATPENGAVYAITLALANNGEGELKESELPMPSDFELFADGETYPLIEEIPGGIDWSQLRDREDRWDIHEPEPYCCSLGPGGPAYVDIAFDAPGTEYFALKWMYETPAGETGTEWIAPPE